MSFKLKYKDKDGDESVEIDFEEVEQTPEGMILRGEDKATGEKYNFLWLSLDPHRTVPPPPVLPE